MLVIKVELHSVITGKVSEIARMHVWNKGNGTETRGHYGGAVFRKGSHKRLREGAVNDYPRKSLHVWNLIARMLKDMGYK